METVSRLWTLFQSVVGPIDGLMAGRMLLAVLLCGLVGIERSGHDRAVGFRPHILVGVGACLMTLAGGYGFASLPTLSRDPMRVASYVVSGIGFLGAGAILRHGTSVRGLTTAASLWISAGIGVAVGAGLGGLAVVTVGLVLFTLGPLQFLESRVWPRNAVNDLSIHVINDHQAVGKTLAALGRLGVPVRRSTVLPGTDESAVLRVDLGRPLSATEVSQLVRRLLTLKCIARVDTAGVLLAADDRATVEENGRGEAVELSDETLPDLEIVESLERGETAT
jgi:putative Mg2+ transporter-C (MgtC) family protein